MKKIIIAILSICILGFTLSGCLNKPDEPFHKNTIAPKELSQEQQDIVNLIAAGDNEVLLFDYNTEDGFKNVEFWVEVYKKGELVERPAGVSYSIDEAAPRNGQLAVLITKNSDYVFEWAFKANEDGAVISHAGESSAIADNTLGRGYGPISAPVPIGNSVETVLYSSFFMHNEARSYSDLQQYVHEPELLKEYPYVHLIKCKFE